MPEYIEFCPYATQHPFYFLTEDRKATRMEAIYDLFQQAYRRDHLCDTYKKGQIITTAKKLSVRWKWKLQQTKSFLDKLVQANRIHLSTAKINCIDTLVISILGCKFIDDQTTTELILENGVVIEIQHNSFKQDYPFKNKFDK